MSVDEHGSTLAAAGDGEHAVLGARYEILALLGSGGMGNVYRARDRELDELVALKVLRPEIVSAAGALERFRREVKLARRVTHPNVARVFDIGEHDGDRILTMELVEGESLASVIRREGALALDRARSIARGICAGVAAAHAAGVVHRDLKPDNVLLTKSERPVVTDFGIARAAAEGSRTVGFVGTPAYMAPEQIDERASIDHRVDVYAFGAVLYEMLTGEAAWQAESLWALAAARLLEPPPDPRSKRPDVPAALAELVLACMARAPADRPASLEVVDAALASMALPSGAPVTRASRRSEVPVATTGVDKRVAVLPFTNAGPPDQSYVADGLTEDLIDALSVARGLRVRSRGVVSRYREAGLDAREVGRELDVSVVVEGSVRRTPNGFRVNARLVSVADGFQLWARRFDVAEGELLAQNDVIARAIADALTVDLDTGPVRAQASGDAVDLYLRARHAFRTIFSGDRREVLAHYERALASAPDDPRALAGCAMAGALQWVAKPEQTRRAFDAAERALAIAPTLSDAHAARGVLLFSHGDSVGAVTSLRRAVQIDPGNAEAHETLGRLLGETVDPDAELHLETALALEPTYDFAYANLWRTHELAGRTERADDVLDRLRVVSPRALVAIEGRCACWRRDAVKAKELMPKLDPSVPMLVRARGWIEVTATGVLSPSPPPPGGDARPPRWLQRFGLAIEVELHAYVGEHAGALALLQRLDAEGGSDHAWLEHCPLLDELRAMPEVAPIRARFAERSAAVVAAYRAPR